MPHINDLPEELLNAIVELVFEDEDYVRPSFLLDRRPCRSQTQFFAQSLVRVNRRFNRTGSRFLWRNLCVRSASSLKKLADAAQLRRSLPASTVSLEVITDRGVSIIQLRRLLEYMVGLRSFAYTIIPQFLWPLEQHVPTCEYTHADFVIHALSSFAKNLRKVVLRTGKHSPSGDGLLELLEGQQEMEVLHINDINPRWPNHHRNPRAPDTFQAKALHTLSFGQGFDHDINRRHMRSLGTFLSRSLPLKAFPALSNLHCMSFAPSFRPLVSKASKTLRLLFITSSNSYPYASLRNPNSRHILSLASNVEHLVWGLDEVPNTGWGVDDDDPTRSWLPLPRSHHSLSHITLIRAPCGLSVSVMPPTIMAALRAILDCELPALETIRIESEIATHPDIEEAWWFLAVLAELRSRNGGRVSVRIWDRDLDDDRHFS